MKCTECGAKCVLVDTINEAGTQTRIKLYECPECCNQFSKLAAPAKRVKW